MKNGRVLIVKPSAFLARLLSFGTVEQKNLSGKDGNGKNS